METSEMPLSLLEISGEDDTLLHHLSANDVSSAFALSPLHVSTSHISSGTKCNAGSTTLNSASSNSNKENLTIIDNKSETCSLNVERQKMKKSKKAGGYNLRKSLAWNKAFFTEEGVLDPVELSMISGISFGDRLSAVDEEPRDSETITSYVDSGSADVAVEENLVKDMPSGQQSRTNMSTPVRKQSIPKVLTGQGLYKSAIKGALCSTPRTPTQKRLLNTEIPKVATRNSKIPRVPLSKHLSLPSTTNIHAPSSGNHHKSPGIPQQAQKYASKGTCINAGGTSKSIKQLGTITRMDTACSRVKIDSLPNHKAQSTNKISNYLPNSSKQSLPVKSTESVDGTSRIRNLSIPQSDKGDGNKKDVQVQGRKPSGLRMPSPSMRYFGEDNMKSSSLKSSIPASKNSKAADHISDFKQIKVRHGSLLQNAALKKRLSSQVTEICSTSSRVDPTTHADVTHGKCNRKVLQQQALLGDKVSKATNDVKCSKSVLNDIDSRQDHETVSALNATEKDMNNDIISFHAESMSINSRNPALQQNGYAGRNTMNSSIASCPEVQLNVAFASNGDVSLSLDEDTRCSSSAMHDSEVIRSETDLNSHHNYYTLANCDSFTNMLYDDKIPGKNKIDDLMQPNAGESMNPQLDGSKLLVDGKCGLEIYKSDSTGPVRVSETVVVENSDGGQQASISGCELTSICSTKTGVVGGVTYEHVDKEEGDVMHDNELSTMKPGECSVQQDNKSNSHVAYHKNCSFFTENRSCSMNAGRWVSKDSSDVGSTSIHSRTSFLDLSNNGAAPFLDLPSSLQGVEESSLSCGHEKVDVGCEHASSVSFGYGTEHAVNKNVEITQQAVNDDSVGKLPIVERDNLDVNKQLLVENSSPQEVREESKFEVSDDVFQMHNNLDGVDTQIDSVEVSYSIQTIDLEAQLSASSNNDQATSAAVEPIFEATSSLVVRHDLPAGELMVTATLDVQSNKPDGSACLEESETNTFKLVDDLTVESECIMEREDSSDEPNAKLKRTIDNLKLTIPASHGVSFSDERLAAIESAGEDILTLKTGAVQHSPPDKSVPDPSPWSPVKRKANQVIGPFDCTKCTKLTNTQLDHSE